MTLNKGPEISQIQSTPRKKRWLNNYITQRPELAENLYRNPDGSFRLSKLTSEETNRILRDQERMLLPPNKVEWVAKGTARLQIWLQTALEMEIQGLNFILEDITVHAEERVERILLMLDIWPKSLSEKEDFLYQTREQWTANRLKEKQLAWLDPKSLLQMEWAMEYLEMRNQALPGTVAKPSMPSEHYDYVVAALDRTTLLHPAEHKLFLSTMRKSWSQYKYRHSGKAKKPLYLFIEEEAKEKLDQIAKQQKRSRHDIIEDWILQAFEKNDL